MLISAFLLYAALALAGCLAGGLALAMRLVPWRGRTDRLRWPAWFAVYATTILACLPALAVFLGLIDFESPPTLWLLLLAAVATGLPLMIPPARLPRQEALIAACLALGAVLAAAALFSVSPRIREARESMHATCRSLSQPFAARQACIAHVDTWLSLPAGTPGP